MHRVAFTPQASADLETIHSYISQFRPREADRMVGEILRVCRNVIASYPDCGTKCDEIAPGLRYFTVERYIVFFRLTSQVEVLRILHGDRAAVLRSDGVS
jgi:toxin ParE1/3/4